MQLFSPTACATTRWLGTLALTAALSLGCAAVPARGSATLRAEGPASALPESASLESLARLAISEDRVVAEESIARLRTRGQAGLDALFAAHRDAIRRLLAPSGPSEDPEALRVRTALEQVARQRDAQAARLYWHTDLEEAKRAAKAENKPILSLRLLGNLDEELSCANSRFFRTALYPNAKVGEELRSRFVLHWKSERPAPRVTIDFGDGRKLERTVTGNSVHYILDAQGRVVDALPGMYGPDAFLRGLRAARGAFEATATLDDDARREALRAYHASSRDALAAEWATLIGVPFAPPPGPRTSPSAAPPAEEAIPVAVAKGAVEAPIVAAIGGDVVPLPSPAQPVAWAQLLERQAVKLDEPSRAFMRSKIAADVDLEGRSMRTLDDEGFARRVASFERWITEDTVRNEHAMHRVLHDWLAMTPPVEEMEAFNARVYASLFLTPRSDPWLGLLVKDGYSGIRRDGVEIAAPAR
ncbi:MAG: hypothetical protein U0441_12395 [Polyangiaceae bacterium]